MNKSWNWFYERCNHPSGDRGCSVHEIRVKGGGGGEIIPGLSHNPPLYFFLSFSLRKSFSNIFKFFIHSFILSFILSLLSLSQFYFSFSLSVLSTFLLLFFPTKINFWNRSSSTTHFFVSQISFLIGSLRALSSPERVKKLGNLRHCIASAVLFPCSFSFG